MATTLSNLIHRTHSNAISCDKHFCISTDKNSGTYNRILFNSPASNILTNEVNSIGQFVHFKISNSDLEIINKEGLEIHHIVEYIRDLSSKNFSYEGCRLYVYIIGNTALFIVKRITDYLFTQVFNFVTAEDLLYYCQACFHTLKLDKSTDQIILFGEIAEDSRIVRLMSIYYSNILTDTSVPISSLSK